jgi:hypothetical protein
MPYSMRLYMVLTTLLIGKVREDADGAPSGPSQPELPEVVDPVLQRLLQLAEKFRQQPVSPRHAHQFERQLQNDLRELGRVIVQHTYNHLEPSDVNALPKHAHFECGQYTRLNEKTPQNAWTLFGQMRLWRAGYRPTDKSGEPTIFPLALSLGLVHGASPALAECAGKLLGGSGMTQRQTLQQLRQNHGVGWGVKKLRAVTDAVSQAMAKQRHETQVEKLLELLRQATASKGRHKPVLSVGRDGITLGVRCKGGHLYEMATTGTVTVLDRRGKRLGTVYLAYVPEAGQGKMSKDLTRLLREVLRRWQDRLPRLCYVSDAGDSETSYYNKVLSRMKHPVTGDKLEWIRVVDYYHASTRLWTMADLLFGTGQRAASWVRKMQKWLLKPGGVNRVLHSAAAFQALYQLKGKKRKEFRTAYLYLRRRMKYMRYGEYRRVGVPLGSGVTEAACKTIYTQRLKLSGMRWKKPGAQTVLNLRVLQLSGVWDEVYQRVLNGFKEVKVGDPKAAGESISENAA